ncbi:MAG: nucleoside triphosphate pyrophosphohydrolase [Anaerolineales bacterium]|nr:nucleoside triphosphate pyrophosphohydrolase [Anaerolineales bacterium]
MSEEILIVGIGPGDPEYVTREAWEALHSSRRIFARTKFHQVLKALPDDIHVQSFDNLYDQAEEFADVYTAIVDNLLNAVSEQGSILYAVPGDPMVGEATVAELLKRATGKGIDLKIIHGISFVEPCLEYVGIDALDGLAISDALGLAAGHHPPFSPDTPVLVAQLYSQLVASDVKLTLMNAYPEEHSVILIHQAGTRESQLEEIPLYEIDRSQDIDYMTTLYIPPLPERSSFESFQETVAHLRAPDGCPWDREQTHQSLRMHLLEECYEALHAIDNGDLEALREELGDLTLQIILQAQIATESGDFRMTDVIAGITEKIVRRHPHVFGEIQVEDMQTVLHNWEVLKAAEREVDGNDKGVLDGVPLGLPALAQANELQSRVARVGFDWADIAGVLDKIEEELAEVKEAGDDEVKAAEIGDVLFAVVNYARWLGVDPESALRQANQRFRERFARLEKSAKLQGRKLSEMTIEEMDTLWELSKR